MKRERVRKERKKWDRNGKGGDERNNLKREGIKEGIESSDEKKILRKKKMEE